MDRQHTASGRPVRRMARTRITQAHWLDWHPHRQARICRGQSALNCRDRGRSFVAGHGPWSIPSADKRQRLGYGRPPDRQLPRRMAGFSRAVVQVQVTRSPGTNRLSSSKGDTAQPPTNRTPEQNSAGTRSLGALPGWSGCDGLPGEITRSEGNAGVPGERLCCGARGIPLLNPDAQGLPSRRGSKLSAEEIMMHRIVTGLALAAAVAATAVGGAAPAMAVSSDPPAPRPRPAITCPWATRSRRGSSPMPPGPASRPIRGTRTSSTRHSAPATRACGWSSSAAPARPPAP